MTRSRLVAILAVPALATAPLSAQEPVFSGPQPGEAMPAFKVKGVFGTEADREFDPIAKADGGPAVIVFFHERTRPNFALTNAVTRYAISRARDSGVGATVVYLTEDATETTKWMRSIRQYFPEGVEHVISPDGLEGPGAYGLNRNVGLTVLVGKGGKVTANFALVQPGVEADGPKILAAIAEAAGGGEPPDIRTLIDGAGRPAGREMAAEDPELPPMVRAVLEPDATPEQVAEAAAKVNDYVTGKPAARAQLGRIAARMVDSGRLADTGTPPGQAQIRRWAERFGRE